jgi:aspartate/methionine/tyrosine aminotransferase
VTSSARVAKALAAWEGTGPVDLLVGEPCFETPEPLRRALAVAADRSAAAYGPAAGLPELRALLAERTRRRGLAADGREIAITHGAKGALLAVLATLVSPGDEIIVPVPGYPGTAGIARRLGATPVGVPETEAGLRGWSDAVVDRIGDRTRAVVVASPSNPSGSVLPDDEVGRLATACAEAGARLVLDEAYGAFRWDAGSAGGPSMPPSSGIVRIRSASKTWGVCGWRVGWVIADEELVQRVVETQAGLLNPPATPPQLALLELDRVPDSWLERAREEVKGRLDGLRAAAAAVGLESSEPGGGFYAWLDVRHRVEREAEGDTVAWCVDRARRAGVGFWPGDDFGCPGRVRAAVPRGDDWRKTIERLADRLAPAG